MSAVRMTSLRFVCCYCGAEGHGIVASCDCAAMSAVTLDALEAISSLCWFLRWLVDEDERRALREFWTAWVEHDDVLNMGDPSGPSLGRFKAAKREMQRRGF